jgi:hypothetical protein
MATYDVKVIVEYNYEVEADNLDEATEQGWQYEDYSHFAEVYSIAVDQTSDDEEEDESTDSN